MRRGVRLKGIKVVNKGGKRYLYRRTTGGLVPLPDLPENDPRFLKAYTDAEQAQPATSGRAAAGSIAALCDSYVQSREFAALGDSSRAVRRRVIGKIRDERGRGKLKDLRPDHIRKDVRALTPGSASNRLKAWRGLFSFAVAEGLISVDPSKDVKIPKSTTVGHRQWTPDEIEAFRKHWGTGTPERIAFEVIYWTGARCVDAATLGSQMVDRSGWLSFVQSKTGGPVTIPITAELPLWASGLAEDHKHLLNNLPRNQMHWIVTQYGKPRSVKGLSQWFSSIAGDAELPGDCTAHGLRKARAAALAEAGATAHQIGAWTGHTSLTEVSHYTRNADLKAILTGPEQEQNSGNHVLKFPK